jgi:succinate-acetate transporter protein
MATHDDTGRVTYDRFLEFERLMRVYPRGNAQVMNPTPLGFCAFALTLFVYSMIQAGATVPNLSSPAAAMGLGLFYGGLILLIAGILEFRVGNNFYALTFCSYAGFWLSLAALYVTGSFAFSTVYTDQTVFQKALGIYFIGWVIFTLAMLIASVRTNAVLVSFFFFLMLTYILLAAGYFLTISSNLLVAGGAIGIFTSAIAWFLGFASLLRRGDNSYFNLPNYSLAPKTGVTDSVEAPVERRKI